MQRSILSAALAGLISVALTAGCSSSSAPSPQASASDTAASTRASSASSSSATPSKGTTTILSSPDPSPEGEATVAPTDFVSLDGVTYLVQMRSSGEDLTVPLRVVKRDVLVGRVKVRGDEFKYEAVSQQKRDGQASFLAAGTPVHAVEGYAPSFRVAARRDGAWVLYEAAENRRTRRGEDLLDIEGKVEYVGLRAPTRNADEEVAAIREPSKVTAIAEAALKGPLRRVFDGPPLGYPVYSVVFHLEDGTESSRAYDPNSGELSVNRGGAARGVVLPKQVRGPIDRALQGANSEIIPSARPDQQ